MYLARVHQFVNGLHHSAIVCGIISVFDGSQSITVILSGFESFELGLVLKTAPHLLFIFSSYLWFKFTINKRESSFRNLPCTLIKEVVIKPFIESVTLIKLIPGGHMIADSCSDSASSFHIQRVGTLTAVCVNQITEEMLVGILTRNCSKITFQSSAHNAP